MKIKCPACGFKNEEGSKFCSNCNTPLVDPVISINKENLFIKKEASNNKDDNKKITMEKIQVGINKKQRVILAIFIPILLFLITLTVAYYVTGKEYIYFYYYIFSNWGKIWYVWLLFLTFCCFFEYKLFEDKEIISNKNKKELK